MRHVSSLKRAPLPPAFPSSPPSLGPSAQAHKVAASKKAAELDACERKLKDVQQRLSAAARSSTALRDLEARYAELSDRLDKKTAMCERLLRRQQASVVASPADEHLGKENGARAAASTGRSRSVTLRCKSTGRSALPRAGDDTPLTAKVNTEDMATTPAGDGHASEPRSQSAVGRRRSTVKYVSSRYLDGIRSSSAHRR